jgi:hypothetical protein
LLSEDYRKFILALSELRNKFVHNVGYCAKSIKDIISTYDKKQLESFALKFSPQDATMLRIANKPVKCKLNIEKPDIPKLVTCAVNDPKLHIWIGAYVLLTTIADNYGYSEYKQFTRALRHLNESDWRTTFLSSVIRFLNNVTDAHVPAKLSMPEKEVMNAFLIFGRHKGG